MLALAFVFFTIVVTACLTDLFVAMTSPFKNTLPSSQLGSLLSPPLRLHASYGKVSPTATPPSLPPADNRGDSQ
jgi:hypothetical protein